MQNIPVVKMGIISVSRGCFPIELSEMRRHNVAKAYGADLYECPICVETELDAKKALTHWWFSWATSVLKHLKL